MNQLANAFSLGFAATTLLVLRLIMIPFLIYNLSWSVKSFWNFVTGKNYPACLYESMIFFMSMGLLGYHLLTLSGHYNSEWSSPIALVLHCLFFLAVIISTIGKRVSLTNNFEAFSWLMTSENLDVAVRVAHLNELDSEYTLRALEAAETTLALRLARKAINDRAS
jgi:hypothetical protein